ncbi:hypothetical protein ACH5RR_029438 [Cinchona calisaya]|uniref:RNA helicase n=1 Tax=Cinchona calisaya TaxID=153742 RepID=A0ABD2YUZ1_9GENT
MASSAGAGLAAEVSTQASSGKKKQKNGRQREDANISEVTRIKISLILEQFLASNDLVHTFEGNLTNRERAVVHTLCRKMGVKSRSSGHGEQRHVSVYKTKKKVDNMNGKENLTSFTFSRGAEDVLRDIFIRYPPGDEESQYVAENLKEKEKDDKVRRKKDDIFSKPMLNKSEIVKKVEAVNSRVEKNQNLRQITEGRLKLPIASFEDIIKATVESHQVVLISGDTGCGKTTQVPQFLLDHMWGKGETCKIVCTQPRRISATSVAERISTERGENVGDTVGYKIRMECKGGKHSSIVFCTNGVLLRVLVSKGRERMGKNHSKKVARDEVSDITHIIVDEIHERDRYSDFMLAILRDMLPSYPHLRLVLMSATIDADRFSNYFGGCPIIRVPGFTYPVKTFYLEDVLSTVKSNKNNYLHCPSDGNVTEESTLAEEYKIALDEAITLALSSDELDPLRDLISSEVGQKILNYQHSSGITPLMIFAGKGSVGDICMLLSLGADCHLRANDGMTALDWAHRESQGETAEILEKHMEKSFSNSEEVQHLLDNYLSSIDPELIDDVLIEQLLKRICSDSQDGAILIFFPGWDDINRTRERLLSSTFFRDSTKFVIISLHSMVPSVEQKKVFKRPPPGCRKLILSTNIAETAVTIDDVVYVIDSGRMKEKSYDPYNNVSTLQSSWISKASAKQREGRAGRCQPGICYHLYSKLRAVSLPDFQVPEIKRMPIEELCLQVKLIDPNCKIEDFLRKTLDPPVYETIQNAIVVLQDIGALSVDEQLTELGKKLGSLPVHPLTSKMLFIAILFNCLDPALTLACASDYRDPFTLPMLPNDKKRAAAAKSELASLYGGLSDQLAVVAAFECWKCAKERGQEARFCSQYFVSSSTMNMISRMRKQLQSELLKNGFLLGDESCLSLNAHDPGILRAVLVAGLYPMVGRLLPPLKGGKRSVVETAGGDKVRLHPHSTNFKLTFKKCNNRPLIAYDEITRGDGGLHIRNCSIIGPLPLLLLATEIVVAPGNEDEVDDNNDESDYGDSDDDTDEDKMENHHGSDVQHGEKIMSSPDNRVKVIVDRWIPFESKALDVAQIYCLRERLSSAILFKVTNPGKVLPEMLGASINAIACILSYDGMSGISFPVEAVEMLTSMVDTTVIGQSGPGRRKGIDQNSNSFLKSLISTGKNQNCVSNYQKVRISGSAVLRNCNSPSNHHQPSSQGLTISGHGSAMYGARISREDHPKRPRGNGP